LLDKKEVEVGNRSIHLVEDHGLMPPEKWLEKHNLPRNLKVIADAMKKDRSLRPPYRWIYQYFAFQDR